MIGLAFGVILGITGIAALAGWKQGQPTHDQGLLESLLITIVAIARRIGVSTQTRIDAVNAAKALGLPKTAQAVAAESRLPTDELWPGTTLSVAEYIARVLAQTTAAQAKSLKPGTTVPVIAPAQSSTPSGPTPAQVQAAAAAAQAQVQAAAASFGPMHGWRRR